LTVTGENFLIWFALVVTAADAPEDRRDARL